MGLVSAMLIFKKLTMENFGPYRNPATLDFPEKGIVVIRGRNGRGKTTILSALRFVLFGQITIYGKDKISLFEYINEIGFENGIYSYSVTLEVELDGVKYRLSRTYQPKDGIQTPRSEKDYLVPALQVKDLTSLTCYSGNKAQHIASQIMTETVSRFYLFDGELLKEYETELSNDDSHTAVRIREGIERILGVPILKNARDHVKICEEDKDKEYQRLSSLDKNRAQIAKTISQISVQKKMALEEKQKVESQLAETQNEGIKLENKLSELDDAQELTKNLGSSEQKINQINETLKADRETLSQELVDAWRGILQPVLTKYKQKYEDEYHELKLKEQSIQERNNTIQKLRDSVSNHTCELCGQSLDNAVLTKLNELLKEQEQETETEAEELDHTRMLNIQDKYTYLQDFDMKEGVMDRISQLEDRIAKNNRQLVLEKNNYNEIVGELTERKISSDMIRELTTKLAQIREKEDNLKRTIEKINVDIAAYDTRKKQLDSTMEAMPQTANIELAFQKKKFTESLYELFQSSVGCYQDELKQKVQTDATKIFLQLTGEAEYTGLTINDNYRLDIVRETGDKIPLRSSGYEHLVAFSLIGALHKNAPMGGPLFMDTSFGRLDEVNSENLIRALPTLSDQVILLVHRRELNEEEVQNLISNDVKAKYSITRVSSRESTLDLEWEV